MNSEFNIIDHISGLTRYTFEKGLLVRVARERGVLGITIYEDLSQEQSDLCKADLLLEVYIGANSTAGYSVSDGSFKESVGSETINDKKYLYGVISAIYSKYGDKKLDIINPDNQSLCWVNEYD